jgi:hypothetical protein
LEKYYIEEKMLVKDIAKIYGCSPATIGKYLTEFNIERRKEHPWTSEWNKILKKKYNKYDLSGEYGIGWTNNTNQEFYFDLEDYEKIKDICWMENNEGYIVGRRPGTNIFIRMHNLVTGFPYVDHIKHKPNDNRKSQLRLANDKYNSRNRSKPVNNASGYKGVCWKTREQKWRAYITVNGNHIELGMYDDINDAIKARKNADEYYYKEWSYENSMNREEM